MTRTPDPALHVRGTLLPSGERLRARTAGGGPADEQLYAVFERGQLPPALFAPPAGAGAVVTVDTSGRAKPAVDPIAEAVAALLR